MANKLGKKVTEEAPTHNVARFFDLMVLRGHVTNEILLSSLTPDQWSPNTERW